MLWWEDFDTFAAWLGPLGFQTYFHHISRTCVHQILDTNILCCHRNLLSKIYHFRQKKHILGEDIIRDCAAEVLISHSMIQTMKPTVHLTLAKRQHSDKSSSSESDSEVVDASLDENEDESVWSAAF